MDRIISQIIKHQINAADAKSKVENFRKAYKANILF